MNTVTKISSASFTIITSFVAFYKKNVLLYCVNAAFIPMIMIVNIVIDIVIVIVVVLYFAVLFCSVVKMPF
jgi:hypothetical protein